MNILYYKENFSYLRHKQSKILNYSNNSKESKYNKSKNKELSIKNKKELKEKILKNEINNKNYKMGLSKEKIHSNRNIEKNKKNSNKINSCINSYYKTLNKKNFEKLINYSIDKCNNKNNINLKNLDLNYTNLFEDSLILKEGRNYRIININNNIKDKTKGRLDIKIKTSNNCVNKNNNNINFNKSKEKNNNLILIEENNINKSGFKLLKSSKLSSNKDNKNKNKFFTRNYLNKKLKSVCSYYPDGIIKKNNNLITPKFFDNISSNSFSKQYSNINKKYFSTAKNKKTNMNNKYRKIPIKLNLFYEKYNQNDLNLIKTERINRDKIYNSLLIESNRTKNKSSNNKNRTIGKKKSKDKTSDKGENLALILVKNKYKINHNIKIKNKLNKENFCIQIKKKVLVMNYLKKKI